MKPHKDKGPTPYGGVLRPSIVSVVAGGWSVSLVDKQNIPGTIIAVNDSLLHLPRVDIVVSMDRMWTEHRWSELRERAVPAWIRSAALKNMPGTRVSPSTIAPWLHVFECDHMSATFTEDFWHLNGTNSGHCAMNLAYVMKPQEVYLFGFDMRLGPHGQKHWYPDYPWKKGNSKAPRADWINDMARAAAMFDRAKIKARIVGKWGEVKSFKRVTAEEIGCGK